jgi:50S ribosomal protein L16 3-hydroxylase
VAVSDDCMTYSIGFRAPSLAELVEGWGEHQADALADDLRYTDPDLHPQDHPGEIGAQALDRLHGLVQAALGDRETFARWFGTHASQPKYPDIDWRPDEPVTQAEVRALLAQGTGLTRNQASRFAFIRQAERAVVLFVDGAAYDCAGDTATFAELVCAGLDMVVPAAIAAAQDLVELVTILINHGSLAFDQPEC